MKKGQSFNDTIVGQLKENEANKIKPFAFSADVKSGKDSPSRHFPQRKSDSESEHEYEESKQQGNEKVAIIELYEKAMDNFKVFIIKINLIMLNNKMKILFRTRNSMSH